MTPTQADCLVHHPRTDTLTRTAPQGLTRFTRFPLTTLAIVVLSACGGTNEKSSDAATVAATQSLVGGGVVTQQTRSLGAVATKTTGTSRTLKDSQWIRVAGEGEPLTLPSTAPRNVRYGHPDAGWHYRTTYGDNEGIFCTTAWFGADPAYGLQKQCDVQDDGAGVATSPPPAPSPTPSPAPAPANESPSSGWRWLAQEWQPFSFTGQTKTVRYGLGGPGDRWVEKVVSDGGTCANWFMGEDPAIGFTKRCEVSDSVKGPLVAAAPSPPPPAPSPVASPAPSPTSPSLMPAINFKAIPSGDTGMARDVIVSGQFAQQPSRTDGVGAFRTTCDFSHMSADDPIVAPNRPGASHLHVFFGNTGVNAYSTADSIRNTGNSTCSGGTANRSGYWVPAVIDTRDGTPVKPSSFIAYYKTGYNGVANQDIRAMPEGLRMVAGDMMASGPDLHTTYTCLNAPGYQPYKSIPVCNVGDEMNIMLIFPQCWDGINLDSPNHKSHMAYAMYGGGCPRTHPWPVPEVTYNTRYRVGPGDDPRAWRLSSDMYDRSKPGGFSNHGDWFNGWKPEVMQTFVDRCVRAGIDCHGNLLGDGRMLSTSGG
jgi:hypothetical protein